MINTLFVLQATLYQELDFLTFANIENVFCLFANGAISLFVVVDVGNAFVCSLCVNKSTTIRKNSRLRTLVYTVRNGTGRVQVYH